ncbi:MAG: hypothetical protein COA60_004225 [Robiginitomaculum sp.]|nr:hypothetical protein [Robiginitomaculum sp.]
MFIIFLKFSENKSQAGQYMAGHKSWLQAGFDDGVFLVSGSLQPNQGGGIVAHNTSLIDLQSRIDKDPFVVNNVVTAQIIEITASKADQKLAFLLE